MSKFRASSALSVLLFLLSFALPTLASEPKDGAQHFEAFHTLEHPHADEDSGADLDDGDEGSQKGDLQLEPERTIHCRDSGPRSCPRVDRQLLAKGELDDGLLALTPEESQNRMQMRRGEVERDLHGGRDPAGSQAHLPDCRSRSTVGSLSAGRRTIWLMPSSSTVRCSP